MSRVAQVVIGLAGHIDHGKTALVKALTGVDTDTQAEEKRRGMTIDIGFAFLTDTITLVDVPGHDRFVKNMVRGVAGIHLGLLVVAADDGIMPQTREHFQILRFLGVPRICVAINKIDLAEEDWVDLVEEDLRKLLEGTPYASSPVLRVSAQTDAGVDALREAIIDAAAQVSVWEDRGFFRLSIDRAFSLKGFGSVVTGTVISGSLVTGDALELLPGNLKVKVRGIQSHGKDVGQVLLGDRAALNVGNLSLEQLARGEQVATPGYVRIPRSLAVDLTLLDSAPTLPSYHPVRVNVGTAEVMAKIKFPLVKKLEPGQSTLAILSLAEPVPVIRGDRFILRSFSPVTTIGGGTIIEVELPTRWKEQKKWVSRLAAVPEEDRLDLVIAARQAQPFTLQSLARRWGWSEQRMTQLLPEGILTLGRTDDPWLLTPAQVNGLTEETLRVVQAFHDQQPYSRGANREHIRQQVDGDERFIEAWLKDLVTRGRLAVQDDTWRMPSFAITLSPTDAALLKRLVDLARSQGFGGDYVEAWANRLDAPVEQVKTLAALAEDQGQLVRVSQRLMLHRQAVDQLIEEIERHFKEHRELSVADLKTITGTSRKHAVPLLEYLDRTGHTLRIGDKRVRPEG